jgi:hypothetical protein
VEASKGFPHTGGREVLPVEPGNMHVLQVVLTTVGRDYGTKKLFVNLILPLIIII